MKVSGKPFYYLIILILPWSQHFCALDLPWIVTSNFRSHSKWTLMLKIASSPLYWTVFIMLIIRFSAKIKFHYFCLNQSFLSPINLSNHAKRGACFSCESTPKHSFPKGKNIKKDSQIYKKWIICNSGQLSL